MTAEERPSHLLLASFSPASHFFIFFSPSHHLLTSPHPFLPSSLPVFVIALHCPTAPFRVDGQATKTTEGSAGSSGSSDNGTAAAQAAAVVDLYPSALAADIDETNAWVYELVNNGVYRAVPSLATSHSAHASRGRCVATTHAASNSAYAADGALPC